MASRGEFRGPKRNKNTVNICIWDSHSIEMLIGSKRAYCMTFWLRSEEQDE